MSSGVYVVYDEVADVYTAPISLKSDPVAERWFNEKMSNNPHAKDYKLYKIGEYDDEKGIISAAPQPLLLLKGGAISE